MLALSVKDLGAKADISPTTIRRYEQFDGPINSSEPALEAIERTLAPEGIELIFPELGKPGIDRVSLRDRWQRPQRRRLAFETPHDLDRMACRRAAHQLTTPVQVFSGTSDLPHG